MIRPKGDEVGLWSAGPCGTDQSVRPCYKCVQGTTVCSKPEHNGIDMRHCMEGRKCRTQSANDIQGGLGGRPDPVRSPLMQARSAGTSEALVFENKLRPSKVNYNFPLLVMYEGEV